MRIVFSLFMTLCIGSLAFAQVNTPTVSSSGTYYLLEAERGMNNQPTKTKFFEFGENNGTQLLAISACKQCMPAIYTYQETDSNDLGFPIYFNNMGLYVFTYDAESFVIIMPNPNSPNDWTNFAFSNFYSKSKAKVEAMNKAKIKVFIEAL